MSKIIINDNKEIKLGIEKDRIEKSTNNNDTIDLEYIVRYVNGYKEKKN